MLALRTWAAHLVVLSACAGADPAGGPPAPNQPVSSASAPPPASGPPSGPVIHQGVGRLPPEVIQRVVRARFGDLRKCYESGLAKKADLAGLVKVSFTIGVEGKVTAASGEGSDLPDAEVVACVVKHLQALDFPAPEGGTVKVAYPIRFSPKDE